MEPYLARNQGFGVGELLSDVNLTACHQQGFVSEKAVLERQLT